MRENRRRENKPTIHARREYEQKNLNTARAILIIVVPLILFVLWLVMR